MEASFPPMEGESPMKHISILISLILFTAQSLASEKIDPKYFELSEPTVEFLGTLTEILSICKLIIIKKPERMGFEPMVS